MTIEMNADDIRNMSRGERAAFDRSVVERIIRFADLQPNDRMSPTCDLSEYERVSFTYIGGGDYFSRNGERPASIPKGENYSVAILQCLPSKGPSLHAHTTEETFLVLSGKWEIYWGEDGEHQTTLEMFDAVCFPPPVFHGARNVGNDEAYLLAVIGGGSPPWPIYPSAIVKRLDALSR